MKNLLGPEGFTTSHSFLTQACRDPTCYVEAFIDLWSPKRPAPCPKMNQATFHPRDQLVEILVTEFNQPVLVYVSLSHPYPALQQRTAAAPLV